MAHLNPALCEAYREKIEALMPPRAPNSGEAECMVAMIEAIVMRLIDITGGDRREASVGFQHLVGPVDVACQPWNRGMCVRGVNPSGNDGFPNMRHIVTCNPQVMLQLVEDVRALLKATGYDV